MDMSVATSGGGGPDMSWYGGGLAEGGNVEPGVMYDVGERGPEKFWSPRAGQIIPNGGLGGSSVTNNIDARGADLGVLNRISRAMEMSHRSAVATAVRASAERAKRVPGGR